MELKEAHMFGWTERVCVLYFLGAGDTPLSRGHAEHARRLNKRTVGIQVTVVGGRPPTTRHFV